MLDTYHPKALIAEHGPRVMIAASLWACAIITAAVGVIVHWESWRDIALLFALAAGCASLAATADRAAATIVHVIALYKHDPMPERSSHRHRVEVLFSADGDEAGKHRDGFDGARTHDADLDALRGRDGTHSPDDAE